MAIVGAPAAFYDEKTPPPEGPPECGSCSICRARVLEAPHHHRRRDAALALIGALLVTASLAVIWLARVSVPRELYVSELGAVGEPTAAAFRSALLLLVLGGVLVAWSMRDMRSGPRVLRDGTPALSLALACSAFLVAAQVPCTSTCPLPLGDSFTAQDLVHTVSAVVAFGAACWAMLQVAFAPGHRGLSGLTLGMALAVGVIAATGGLLSLLRWNAVFGSRLELVATTVGIGWLVVFGVARASRLVLAQSAMSNEVTRSGASA